uniref:Secreted protein n=1 Tax=Anopheles darlingi TaxID=43151 RepID=A0A2M4D0K3_ANODA
MTSAFGFVLTIPLLLAAAPPAAPPAAAAAAAVAPAAALLAASAMLIDPRGCTLRRSLLDAPVLWRIERLHSRCRLLYLRCPVRSSVRPSPVAWRRRLSCRFEGVWRCYWRIQWLVICIDYLR